MNVPQVFISSAVDGRLDCFQVWATGTKAIMNILVHVFLWIYIFILGGKYLGVEFLGYRGIAYLTIYKTAKKILYSTILHACQQHRRVPVAPHPRQRWVLSIISASVVLVDMKWYLAVIWISLMTNGVTYLFMCLLAIYLSSFEECMFKCFPHYFNLGVCLFIIDLLELFKHSGYKSFIG